MSHPLRDQGFVINTVQLYFISPSNLTERRLIILLLIGYLTPFRYIDGGGFLKKQCTNEIFSGKHL